MRTPQTPSSPKTGQSTVAAKVKKAGIYVGVIGACLSAAVAWAQLELPTPVMSYELAAVEKFNADTRVLILNAEWFRLAEKLDRVESNLKEEPMNTTLMELRRQLKNQMILIERQIEKLEEE